MNELNDEFLNWDESNIQIPIAQVGFVMIIHFKIGIITLIFNWFQVKLETKLIFNWYRYKFGTKVALNCTETALKLL